MACGCASSGLGLDVPSQGVVLHGNPCTATDPAQKFVMLQMVEQMLSDLGFYHGPIGPGVDISAMLQLDAALEAYGKSKGITDPSRVCSAIVADWQAKQKTSGTVLIVVGVLGLGLALYIASKSKKW